jgi:hypothetical protein
MNHSKKFSASMLLFLIFIFSSIESHADTLTSPFALQLSQASTLTLLGGLSLFQTPSGVYQTTLPDETVTTPYTATLSGIHLTIDYAFNPPVENAALSEWSIQSTSLSADLVVDSIDASQVIVEQSGGTTLNVRVDAICTNVHLALAPNSTSAAATVGLSLTNGKAQFVLDSFTANWTPAAWQVVSLNCQGPAGFTQLAEQAITTQLESINPFVPTIQTAIQTQLDAAATSVSSFNLTPNDSSGVSITLTSEQLSLGTDGTANLSGIANFNFSKLNQTACQNTIATVPNVSTTADTLAVPLTAIPALLNCAYLNGTLNTEVPSTDFSAFQSLLGDWILKLFVWPNLVHFNGSSVFNFDISTTAAPTFTPLTSSSTSAVDFNLATPIKVSVFAPTSSGLAHYVDFSTELSGPGSMSVSNGILTFTEQSSVPLTQVWDPAYVQAYRPDEHICDAIIGHDLREFLAKTGLTYTLPTWSAPGAFSLAIDGMSSDGTSADLALDIKKLTSSTQ